ncbi:hypothetical protein H0H93_016493 [Arthromyces matolae]|nr:hypothetical protein H0H93_016493 [Arthromyces matolae]
MPMKYSDWPTLGEMIESGKRVVVFMDAGADTSLVNFILPEFSMIWETPFDPVNDTFPCSVDRIHGPLSTEDHMYLINHGLDINFDNTGLLIPDPAHAPKTNGIPSYAVINFSLVPVSDNALASIINNVDECAPLAAGRAPTFILLDFVDLGNGTEAANILNGLPSVTCSYPSSHAVY